MISFNKKVIKDNLKYLLGMLGIILLIILISIVVSKADTSEEVVSLDESGESLVSKLVINEIMTDNDGAYTDQDGNSYDWIEIYNGNNKDINLKGYSLSDDPHVIKWTFGEVIIKAKEHLIVFLAGENKDGLYTNFSLKKEGGETLTLKNIHGKVVDIVETIRTGKNNVMARDLEGNWKLVDLSTPGYVNSIEGYNEYIGGLKNLSNDILINEVLVRNGGQFRDDKNEFVGYIELKNTTDKTIDLKGYSLSNEVSNPFKWKLPDMKLKKGEILLIYTSGKDIKQGQLHTSFKLESKNGEVVLSKNGLIVGLVEYENLANGYALSYQDNAYIKTGVLSGGFENNSDGVKEFARKYEAKPDDLIINEVMNNNYEYLPNNSHNYYDWIEFKNNSKHDINLSDYYVSNTLDDIHMYRLPDKVLKPGELYVIMASGDSNLTNNSYYHANFKISNVESIYLSKDKVVDSIFISDIKNGYSFGRGDVGYIYMEKPTPLKENSGWYNEVSYAPTFSYNEGLYKDTIEVAINSPGNIYYTLNGDNPTRYSKKYTEPITISKAATLKAINIEDGKYSSEISNASYMVNTNHTLPVVSISIDKKDYNAVIGNTWGDTEREAHVSYFDGDKSFDINCGFKLFGGSVRGHDKKSFALKFKKQYGDASLNYQVYENRDNSVYETLVLRSGSQDSNVSMIRDAMMTSLMEESNVLVQAMKPVILYINGEYWGIYFLNEKVDEDFISARFNVDGEGTNIIRVDGEVSKGSKVEYENLLKYMNTHNMALDETYDYISSKIDMDSLVEFWVAETYITNNDIINCRLYSNPNVNDGKWGFIFYDLDYGMYYYRVNYYEIMTDPNGMGSMEVRSDLTLNLFKSPKFRKKFLEKLSEMLKTNFKEENILERIDYYYNLLKPEMEANAARWGFKMSDWEKEIEKLRTFVNSRRSYLLKQTKSFFKLTDEEMKVFYE